MKTFLRMATCCTVALLGCAVSAWAAGDNFQAPELKQPPAWLSIVLTLGFVVAATASAFKNSRRAALR